MTIGTPANTVAGAVVGSVTVTTVSIPAVSAGNVLLFISYGRRASTTLPPDDPILVDTSAVPLTWTKIFLPQPVQVGANPGNKGNWWWAISDGAAKTLQITWPLAGSSNSIFTSVASFTIGAGKSPDFTNKNWSSSVSGGPLTVNLPVTPTTGINLLSYYGAGGSTSTIASGYTNLTSVTSTPYRVGYDLTPVTATTMGAATFPDAILLVANITEVVYETFTGTIPVAFSIAGNLSEQAPAGNTSKYSMGPYGVGLYSEVSTTPVAFEGVASVIFAVTGRLTGIEKLAGTVPVVFNTSSILRESMVFRANTAVTFSTSAKITSGIRMAGSATIDFAFPLSRLSYIGYFDTSSTAVTFGTSARLSEIEPLAGTLNVELNISNAPLGRTSTLYAAFTVDTYYPMARFVMNRGYHTETTVDFGFDSYLTRSSTRLFTADAQIVFDTFTGPFYTVVPMAGRTKITFDIDGSGWYGGDFWAPDEAPDTPWTPEAPPSGSWTPISAAGFNWVPDQPQSPFWIPDVPVKPGWSS